MARTKNPLTANDKERLQAARRLLADTVTLIDAAKACGQDCAGAEEAALQLYNQLEAFAKYFLGGAPAPAQ